MSRTRRESNLAEPSWMAGSRCSNGKVVEESTPMQRTIQVLIFRGEQKYVAECLDLPVVTEASTLDELAVNIREAISLHLEGEDLPAMGLSDDPTILATMELPAVA
jgi:predicted RNase H-like HicB family nuclease